MSAVLSDDEEKWLEQHGSIRIGWLNHDPGISEFDGESGKVKINENPLHLPDLLHDIRTIVQPNIASKQLDFLIDTVDVRDEDIIADKLRLT